MTNPLRRRPLATLLCTAAAFALAGSAAWAADIPPAPTYKAPVAVKQPNDIILELGPGVQVKPEYPGSKDYQALPTGFFTLHYLQLPGFGVVKDGRTRDQGWSFGPSFNYMSKRKTSDHPELF